LIKSIILEFYLERRRGRGHGEVEEVVEVHKGKVSTDQFASNASLQAIDFYIDLNLPKVSKKNLKLV